MQVKFRFSPIAAAAAALIAAGALVACGGGGGSAATTTTGIPLAGAGNSPFVGVTMKAECANGTSGTGVIGTDAAPGDGTITVNDACNPPIKITAISSGFMRPLGSTTNVTYDPAVNLPVSNMLASLPTTAAPGTANPVTTLVADKVVASNPTLDITTAAAIIAAIPTEQANVATSLGIADTEGDYRVPAIASASTRLAQVIALAVQQAALTPPAAVTAGTKTLGQFVAEKIAAAATGAGTLNTAANIAAKLNTGTDSINVTGNAKVTGANTVAGSIDRDAEVIQTIVARVANTKGVVGASVAELLTQIKDSTDPTVTAGVAEHIQAAKTNEISNKSAQLVLKAQSNANANANSATSVKTEADTRLAAVKAAVAKINNALTAALANSATPTAAQDALAHFDTVLSGVDAALTKDATATSKIFASPPTVGVVSAVEALVANIEKQTTGATAPSTTVLATALTVAKAIADLAPPPVPGGVITQTDADAYRAAVAAIATKLGDKAGSIVKADLQTSVDNLKTATQTQLNGVTSNNVDRVELAQKAAEAALTGAPDNFTTPPTPGTVPVITPPTPPAALQPPPSDALIVVTKAQQDEAIAQSTKATTAATAAQTQATAASTAASAAAAATTVAAAQTAANAAQAAATAAHTARVDADAASAAAAKANPGSAAATDAAAKANAAASADTAAAASSLAATESYNALVAKLQAAQLAAAQAAQAAADSAASLAATKAQEAAGFATSATAATTAAAAQTAADGAQAAATAAQAAADTAKTQAAEAATQLPGSPQANAASSASTAAQASATAAKASAKTASDRAATLTASEAAAAAQAAAAQAAATSAAADATTAATQATAAATAAASAAAATTSASAQTFATAADAAATAAQTAATHAAAQAALAAGSAQASAATASATAAQTSATAASASATAAAAKVTSLKAAEAAAGSFAGVCEVKFGSAIGYVTNVPAASSCVGAVLNVDGGGASASVAPATLLTGKTSVSFTAAATCDALGAPPAAGATTLTACKL